MSGLVHYTRDVGPDVVALSCPHCGARFAGAPFDEILEFGEHEGLRCLDCLQGGLIPHRESRLDERFPPELSRSWTPVPNALLEQRGELGLGPHELVVILALEHHRRAMGDEVWPSSRRLQALTGLSEGQVKRATRRLAARGLVGRRRLRRAGGLMGNTRYQLDALWSRLADLTTGHQRPMDSVTTGYEWPMESGNDQSELTTGHTRPLDHRSPVTLTTGHQRPVEVDAVREVDAFSEEDPVGTSTAASADARVDGDSNPGGVSLASLAPRIRRHPRVEL